MDGERIRLVVVDDAEASAQALAGLLRNSGHEVWAVSDGADALRVIEQRKPHCVLFEVVMPGLSGDALGQQLRDRYGDDIVLIALSACDATDARVQHSFSLADHYFTKPVDPAALAKLLRPFG